MCGDALGAPYAIDPDMLAELPADGPVPWGYGGRWEAGGPYREAEWTENTAMAVPALAKDLDVGTAAGQRAVIERWLGWSHSADKKIN